MNSESLIHEKRNMIITSKFFHTEITEYLLSRAGALQKIIKMDRKASLSIAGINR